MRNISVEVLNNVPVFDQSMEIVERKGIGHPDYICDAVMEEISLALARRYLDDFGMILHYNIDKGLLAAGKIERRFGGGKVIEPMELIIGDRATFQFKGKTVPVKEIAIETARKWFKKNIRMVDPEKDVKYRAVLAPGSEELTGIFSNKRIINANDTSAAVGCAPLTSTENSVLKTEAFLNSKEFKSTFTCSGEDVKVMGLRNSEKLILTIAMPLLCSEIESEEAYFKRKEKIVTTIREYAEKNYPFKEIDIHLNTLDKRGEGLKGVYLSLLGTSAEDADSGQVGRGNRVNGVISLNRPMGTEAAAGKNPMSHVGKIYNILSYQLADEVYRKVPGIKEVNIWLLSQIGRPIDSPLHAAAQLILVRPTSTPDIVSNVKEIINSRLTKIEDFCMDLTRGKYPVC